MAIDRITGQDTNAKPKGGKVSLSTILGATGAAASGAAGALAGQQQAASAPYMPTSSTTTYVLGGLAAVAVLGALAFAMSGKR